ncbi:MAG: hypothetical protein U0939_01360 [Pirellulales bacterium]
MSQFILIDQSLSEAGGHHYECAQLMLAAAEQRGWRPVVAANRSFKKDELWPDRWPVQGVFRESAYHRFSVLTGVAEKTFNPFETWTEDLRSPTPWRRFERWHQTASSLCRRFKQRKRLRAQAQGLRAFWESIRPQRGDLAFLQTVTEYDLVWFTRFLSETPGTDQIDWHLQFHNTFLDGRDPQHAGQTSRLIDMQRHFWSLLQRLPRHRLHFYCTTPAMTRQFVALSAAPFELLECAVHPDLLAPARPAVQECPTESVVDSRPLRVVCGGYGRQEKGWKSLATIIDEVWSDLFESGRCELQIQTSKAQPVDHERQSKRGRLRTQAGLVDASNASVNELERVIAARTAATGRAVVAGASPIRRLPYPMPPDDYRRFLRNAHIGLFPYDPQRYYARYSAVLVEMLCIGVPVIVPAATWLAEQVAEVNQRHMAEMRRSGDVIASATPRNGESWDLPALAGELVLEFRGAQTPPGTYARVQVAQFDRAGQELDRCTLVDRPPPGCDSWASLVRIVPGAATASLQVADLDGEAADRWRLVRVQTLAPTAEWPQGRPLGAVGLAAADEREFGRRLREISRFHAHYQATARRFAVDYSQRHTGDAILQTLVQSSLPAASAVRPAA